MTPRKPLDPMEEPVQRYILERMKEALDGRSWSWLAERAGLSQSTLAQQVGRVDDPNDWPKFSVAVIVRAAAALRRPVAWFFPGADDAELEADAYRQIAAVVQRTEAGRDHS